MAMNFKAWILLSLSFLLSIQLVCCLEFQVGERAGWIVPSANHTNFYNEWASTERFMLGDTLRFKYRKDSVMEVSRTDYNNCNVSTRPNFFSNTGNTIFTLDRSGLFYFISGATGHCPKGQRMIIRVLAPDDHHSSTKTSSSTLTALISSFPTLSLLFISFAYY